MENEERSKGKGRREEGSYDIKAKEEGRQVLIHILGGKGDRGGERRREELVARRISGRRRNGKSKLCVFASGLE
jgi:hypothetical protein